MANKIILKKSSVAGKVPLSTDLDVGEVAVNLADAKLYSKNAAGTVIAVGGGGGTGDVVGPSSATDNALARFDGTTGKLIQNSVVIIDDAGNSAGTLSQSFADGTAQTVAAGKMWYNGTNGSWNLGMGGGNITQQIGEELFRYGKASAAITDSPLQLVYKTGVVGASGVISFAPAVAGITDGNNILGCATESIALNGFGRITTYGIVHGVATNGTAYGETWADNDDIYYNPTTGGLTKNIPSAPGLKLLIGTVINAGAAGSGSFIVKLGVATYLSKLSDVQFGTLATNNLLRYDGAKWVNVTPASVTGIGSVANALSAGTGLSYTSGTTYDGSAARTVNLANTAVTAGSYTNSAITVDAQGRITAASSGTAPVTSVGATAPIQSSGGVTPTISITQASSTTNGYLNSTDWNTFNNKTSNTGTVTSVGITVPTGLSVSGTPVTTSGTFAVTLTAGYSIPTTASQTNWDSAYTQRLQWDGGSTNLVAATGRSSLGGTTVGQNFFTLTNPAAITFPRINANNTVSALDAATFRTAIGAGTGSGTVTSVGGTGTVAGISLSGTVTSSGNLTLGGTFALPSGQVPTKMIYDSFTATAAQTTFTPSTTYTASKIEVYVNGVKMVNGSDVTVTSGTSVVFSAGLTVGDLVSLVYPT